MRNEQLYIEKALLNELLKGADLQKLINLSAKILENPIVFSDVNRIPVILSDDCPNDYIEDLINLRQQTPVQERQSFVRRVNETIQDGKPHILAWPFIRRNQIICGCIINNSIEGIISLPNVSKSLDKVNLNLVETISVILATAHIINRCPKNDSNNHRLLWGILTSKYSDTYLQNNIYWSIFDNIKTFRLLWYFPIGINGNRLSDKSMSHIDTIMKHWWRIPFEEGYVVMTDGEDAIGLKKLADAAKDLGLLISTSDTYTDIKSTIEQLRISQDTLRYASNFGMKEGIAMYNDFKIFRLLSISKEHVNIKELQHDAINAIASYDAENNSDYGLTLRTYLLCDLNMKETADRLCIHKNTASYRIKRLQELFDLNFHDIKQITTLYYSII